MQECWLELNLLSWQLCMILFYAICSITNLFVSLHCSLDPATSVRLPIQHVLNLVCRALAVSIKNIVSFQAHAHTGWGRIFTNTCTPTYLYIYRNSSCRDLNYAWLLVPARLVWDFLWVCVCVCVASRMCLFPVCLYACMCVSQNVTSEGCLKLLVLPSIHHDTLEVLSALIKAWVNTIQL